MHSIDLANWTSSLTLLAVASVWLGRLNDSDWKHVLDVNLKGTFLMIQAIVPHMRNRKHGKIVNMASIAGRTASPLGGPAYAVAKGGILSFTRQLAKDLGPDGSLSMLWHPDALKERKFALRGPL